MRIVPTPFDHAPGTAPSTFQYTALKAKVRAHDLWKFTTSFMLMGEQRIENTHAHTEGFLQRQFLGKSALAVALSLSDLPKKEPHLLSDNEDEGHGPSIL